ncbi:MAG: DUF202 domain-containing protein [Pseudonocardiales bacterium]|nr:DUF202 domain-containing protein [Pseudonocardiales bacterium]
MSRPDAVWDPGAQAERTALAWQRTGLSVAALGLLLVHARPAGYGPALWAGVLLLVAGGALAAVVAPVRYRHIERVVRSGGGPASSGTVPATALVVLAGIAAIAALLAVG